jgi:hypothetical protein
MRNIYQTRSNRETNSVVASSAATFSICTKDPLLTVTSAPTSTLMLRLGNTQSTPFAIIRPSTQPTPPPYHRSLPSGADRKDTTPILDQQQVQQPEPESEHDRQPLQQPAPEPGPDRQRLQHPEPEPGPDHQPLQQPEPELDPGTEAKSPESSHSIELIIDSLTNHTLIEPISVSITPLGEELSIAAARDLGIQATGNDIGEALIALKQQIEEIYDTLSKRTHLDPDEKVKLQTLHTYIERPAAPVKKRWL